MEFEDIVVKESPGLCRCCLSEGCYKDLGSEYTWMNETEVYADMLLECFDISITQHNDGPNGPNRLICEVCITRLRDACNFKKQVLDSEKKFIDMVARGEFRPKMVIYQAQLKSECIVDANLEDDAEYLEDDVDLGDDDYVKDESANEPTVSALPVKRKRGRPSKNSTVAKTEKKTKVAKNDDKPKTSKAVAKGKTIRRSTQSIRNPETTQDNNAERLARIRKNLLSVLQFSTLVPFTWTTKGYRCFYCSKTMRDCCILKEHTQKHDVQDLERFLAKRIISKDLPVKVDMTDISCKFCPNYPISDIEELITHFDLHGIEYDTGVGVCLLPFRLAKDLMQCALCEEQYDNFTSMLNHMHKEHINHGFMCQICGLSFISYIRLKRHIRSSHVGYRCKACGKMFNAAAILRRHKQLFHGSKKTFGCELCSESFDSNYQLKSHLGKAHNVEKYVMKCELCPKVLSSKRAMVMHMQANHSTEKYECDICDYSTGIKWLMTLHRKKHVGEREYGCSVCEKMFRRASNLRAHMKVHSGSSGRVCRFCRKGFVDLEQLNRHGLECKNERL